MPTVTTTASESDPNGITTTITTTTTTTTTAAEGTPLTEDDQGTPLTEDDVHELQAKWGTAITDISTAFLANGDYMAIANAAAAELYGFGHSKVLFKPTKAAEVPFRPTGTDGMSYFVGGAAVGLNSGGHSEDKGFATNGGKGWSKVVFKNHNIELLGPVAISMGHYIFTCATGEEKGQETSVEVTFGYKRNADGKARIFLHHSSMPYRA